MDPFRYVDLNETGAVGRPPASSTSDSDPTMSLPLVLPGTPGQCREMSTTAGHRLIRTKAQCINEGVHIITTIVQTKSSNMGVLPGPIWPNTSPEIQSCSFCKKNGERPELYMNHQLHYVTEEGKRVSCPILRSVKCPICQATGDFAHTLSHCPYSTNRVSVALMLKSTARQGNGSYRKGYGLARPVHHF